MKKLKLKKEVLVNMNHIEMENIKGGRLTNYQTTELTIFTITAPLTITITLPMPPTFGDEFPSQIRSELN